MNSLSLQAGKQIFSTLSLDAKAQLIIDFFKELNPENKTLVQEHINESSTIVPITGETFYYVMVDMKYLDETEDTFGEADESRLIFLNNLIDIGLREDIHLGVVAFIDYGTHAVFKTAIPRHNGIRQDVREWSPGRELQAKMSSLGFKGMCFADVDVNVTEVSELTDRLLFQAIDDVLADNNDNEDADYRQEFFDYMFEYTARNIKIVNVEVDGENVKVLHVGFEEV